MTERAHGLRSTYQAGCRCLPCRAANAAYRSTALVPANTARAHLAELDGKGIGDRQIAALAGVARATVQGIQSGAFAFIRASTEQRLLSVKPIPAKGALVPSWPVRRQIQNLEREGFTRDELAERFRIPKVTPPGRKVRVLTALKVRAAYVAMECGVEVEA